MTPYPYGDHLLRTYNPWRDYTPAEEAAMRDAGDWRRLIWVLSGGRCG